MVCYSIIININNKVNLILNMLYNIYRVYPVNEDNFVFYFLLLLMIYQSNKTLFNITIFILCTNAIYLIYLLYIW